jgi:hypothetical protein
MVVDIPRSCRSSACGRSVGSSECGARSVPRSTRARKGDPMGRPFSYRILATRSSSIFSATIYLVGPMWSSPRKRDRRRQRRSQSMRLAGWMPACAGMTMMGLCAQSEYLSKGPNLTVLSTAQPYKPGLERPTDHVGNRKRSNAGLCCTWSSRDRQCTTTIGVVSIVEPLLMCNQ